MEQLAADYRRAGRGQSEVVETRQLRVLTRAAASPLAAISSATARDRAVGRRPAVARGDRPW
jgi:hypothetical protein